MDSAFNKVVVTAEEFQVNWRDAAYIVALRRLEKTYKGTRHFPISHDRWNIEGAGPSPTGDPDPRGCEATWRPSPGGRATRRRNIGRVPG